MNRSRLISRFSRNLLLTAFLLVLMAWMFVVYVQAEKRIDLTNHNRHVSFLLADELRQSSDDLSRMVRTYVVTGDPKYKRYYQDILDIRDGKKARPDNYERIYWDVLLTEAQPNLPAAGAAIPLLERMRQGGFSAPELLKLEAAKANSDRLAKLELEAMELAETPGTESPAARAKAQLLLHDQPYHEAKAGIMKPIGDFFAMVDRRTKDAVARAERQALLLRYVFMAFGVWFLVMLWRTYEALLATLGGSPDEVLAHISRIGRGDFSVAMPVANNREPSVMRSLAETQTHLASLDHERKQAEQALRQTNAYLENLMGHANALILVWDPQLQITRFNRAFESLTGRPAAEVIGQPLGILFSPPLVESLMALARRTAEGERWESVEIPIRSLDGTTRTALWNVATLFAADGQTAIATIAQGQDITQRKAAEERLRLLTTTVEAAANGVVITDAAGTILWVNAAFTTLTGYSAAEVVGQNPRILKAGQHPPEFYREMQETISAGQVWHGEITNRRKDGSLYLEEMTITPVRQAAGAVTHFIAIKQDITTRQQAEAERGLMEVQLRQAQKLESIGQLAAGIAHEINTPTQYIGDNTRFLQDAFKDITKVLDHYDRLLQAARQQQVTPELVSATTAAVEAADLAYLTQETPKSIEQTLQGVARVAKIVRAMKDFSHPGAVEKVPTDLNQAIESTVTVAHNEWKYVADLDLVLEPHLPRVSCLPAEINQVILNLVINAAHAIGDVVGDGSHRKGRIRVSTSQQGEWVEIRVQDSGTGIPESARARIFEPFFTTKAVGKGTGQGLAIAHLVVVKQHGGTIEFETERGQGTTFIVRLPLQSSAAQERNV